MLPEMSPDLQAPEDHQSQRTQNGAEGSRSGVTPAPPITDEGTGLAKGKDLPKVAGPLSEGTRPHSFACRVVSPVGEGRGRARWGGR